MTKNAKSDERRKVVVVCGNKTREFWVGGKQKTITVWRLGSEKLGWIPRKESFEMFVKNLSMALKDSNHHIVWNFGVSAIRVKV